jgi:hypothetical protein
MRRAILAVLGLFLVAGGLLAFEVPGIIKNVDADKRVLYVHAKGQDRTVRIAEDAKFLDKDGKPLADGLKSQELKDGTAVTLTVEPVDGRPTIKTIKLGGQVETPKAKAAGKPSVGLKPLTEMSATDRYKGEDGGLYGGGKNAPPPAHAAAARKEIEQIVPRDAEGKPAADGMIAFVSLSMSNATQEFSTFKPMADNDPEKSPRVKIVDCAQGGQAMAQWVDPKGRAWTEADRRLKAAEVSPNQVQVAWVKLANVGPTGDLSDHGKKLQQDTLGLLHNAKARFPNLRIAYLSSRIYAGYANTRLNPEPYAYEGAFPIRWLIQDQIKGVAGLNYDPTRGAVQSPLLLWGPYLWADGTTPRKSDGLVWDQSDLAGDGTHPSMSGRRKVAEMLLKFFKTDPFAAPWFVGRAAVQRPKDTLRPTRKATTDEVSAAVGKALPLLWKGAEGHVEHRSCFGCHNQGPPILAITAARERGFGFPDAHLREQLEFIAAFLERDRENYRQGKGQGGQVDTAGYALLTLEVGGWKPDATTEAVVEYLLQRDQDRGYWRTTSNRPPSEWSQFTPTYLAIRALNRWSTPEQKDRAAKRIDAARRWLVKTPAQDTEDRVFRLLGLLDAGAAEDARSAADELAKSQRDDGGWGQTDEMASDAYATGTALFALHRAGGLSVKDPAYQRGAAFLVKTQLEDGSWLVLSRSRPFQTYFESGFPHGKDQFISMAASGWATAALCLALPPKRVAKLDDR